MSALAGLGVLLVGCETRPEIRTQAAAQVELASYRTYAFVPKPSTDSEGYKTITTQSLESAVSREMQARGYALASPGQQPDLVVNFSIKTHDRVESRPGAAVGVGYGWGWGRWGWGGLGDYYNEIQTVTDGSLTVDVVDRARNEAVWSGTAVGRLTRKVLDNPGTAIDRSVADIFAHYPRKPAGQALSSVR
jgi:hypothetical protein